MHYSNADVVSGELVLQRFQSSCVQDDAEAASKQWRQVADQLRPKVPKLAALMDEAETDALAFMSFPKDHREEVTSAVGSAAKH